MKIQFTLPTNEEFFNRYSSLAPTISKLSIMAQLISAMTEIGIIYSIILSRVIDFFPQYATAIAAVGAIIGTAFLEIGLRRFTPYSINAFLYKRFKGLDLAMTVFILLVNLGLLSASAYLSFKGSKELVKIAAPSPKLASTDKADVLYTTKQSNIQQAFKSDSLTIANGYQKQIDAQHKKYDALIAQQQTKLNQYQRKEQRTRLSYTTRKESIKGTMAGLAAEKAQEIATLEAARAKELNQLLSNRKEEVRTTEKRYAATIGDIKKENDLALSDATTTVANYGLGLGWFTILCLFVFVCATIIDQIHKRGSGVDAVAIPNQYHFSQSILDDLFCMVSDKWNYFTRSRIQGLADKTPPPPLPVAPPTLYDLTTAKQQRLAFAVQDATDQQYVLLNQVPTVDTQKAPVSYTHLTLPTKA